MKLVFLSGGTGTPKLLQGFRQILDDNDLTVICNTGDDFVWNGLHISPDLDTVLYLFGNQLDIDKFWGVRGDTFQTLEVLKSLNALDTWFNIGDKDLGLHLFRTLKLRNGTLTSVTSDICDAWEIKSKILPMSNNMIQSIIHTPSGKLPFQEFFVKYKTEPEVISVSYSGDKTTTQDVISQLETADHVIIGPSNPITSIGPILSIPQLKSKLEDLKDIVTIISPLISNKAFSGPTVKLMESQNVEATLEGLGKYYQEISSRIIIDQTDHDQKNKLEQLGFTVNLESIDLKTMKQKQNLARTILNLI